jgi:hypothetical protein
MVSRATAPIEPRAPRWTRAVIALLVAAPVVLLAAALANDGWLSDTHGTFLSRVRFATERGRLELLGFEYPPLPFLLLVPWADVAMTWVLGGLGVAALAWLALDESTDRRSILPLILLVAALWTPAGAGMVTSDFNEVLGLVALFVGWKHYRRWWATRQTIHGLRTGIWLGLAFYTSPLGLALALVAGAVLPLLFPRLQIPPFASQLVLLVFPGFAATATWAYLSWVFTGHVALPFTQWRSTAPHLGTVLLWSSPYVLVTLMAMLKPRAVTAGLVLPLMLLTAANLMGWNYSLGFATVLLALVAIVALPREMDRASRTLVGAVAVAQAAIAWLVLPLPSITDEDRAARTVAEALMKAPDRSVLVDERYAPRLLKWAPSLAPFLTTQDTGFEIAYAQPAATVRYVLATPDDEGLTLDADVQPPAGFVPAWSWHGYHLWRHPDAPVPVLRFDRSGMMGDR